MREGRILPRHLRNRFKKKQKGQMDELKFIEPGSF